VVNWHQFVPFDFEYDFYNDKLAEHGITFQEAMECFYSNFEVRRNKRFHDRYQLIGKTIGGRNSRLSSSSNRMILYGLLQVGLYECTDEDNDNSAKRDSNRKRD
jgi:uncharacterized DUF497 family protein